METAPPPTVAEVLSRRRTTRRFDPTRPLADDLLTEILRLATFAPSAYNLQPWRFLVVRNEPNRRRLRALAFNHPVITQAPVVVIVLGYLTPDRSHLPVIVETMRDLGAVTPAEASETFARATRSFADHADRPAWATRTAMLAVSTILIAAESLGVASAWIEAFQMVKIRDIFGIPNDHAPCGLVALGHAAEPGRFPGRLSLDDVCFAEHFGQPWKLTSSSGEHGDADSVGLDSPQG